MSELFTQTNKQKELFRTEEDIVANIQTQFGMPHTGKDLLLDAKMGPNKDQSSRLDSEPDALSDTGMSDDVGAGDTSGAPAVFGCGTAAALLLLCGASAGL